MRDLSRGRLWIREQDYDGSNSNLKSVLRDHLSDLCEWSVTNKSIRQDVERLPGIYDQKSKVYRLIMSFSVKIQGWIAEKKIIEVGVCLQEKKKQYLKCIWKVQLILKKYGHREYCQNIL